MTIFFCDSSFPGAFLISDIIWVGSLLFFLYNSIIRKK